MDELLSEKEQIELIRDWWKENGTYVIAGLVIGIGGIFGFNQWKNSQIETRTEASALFERLADEVGENRIEPAEAIAAEMYADYPETIYADQARLAMARLYMDQGRDEDAASVLRATLDAGSNVEMQMIARLRLAKVLLYQGKPDAVLTLLEGHADTGLEARYNEAIGDAHVELGNYAEAEAAYQAALADPRAAQLVDSALLQMKINDLPEILPPAAGGETTDDGAAETPPDDARQSSGEMTTDAGGDTTGDMSGEATESPPGDMPAGDSGDETVEPAAEVPR